MGEADGLGGTGQRKAMGVVRTEVAKQVGKGAVLGMCTLPLT